MQKLTSKTCEHQSDFFDSTPANVSKGKEPPKKNYKILQIVPLGNTGSMNYEMLVLVIGMALLEENGETRLAYIAHDQESGRPVIRDNH